MFTLKNERVYSVNRPITVMLIMNENVFTWKKLLIIPIKFIFIQLYFSYYISMEWRLLNFHLQNRNLMWSVNKPGGLFKIAEQHFINFGQSLKLLFPTVSVN